MSKTNGMESSSMDFEFMALNEALNYRRALIREFRPNLLGKVIEIGSGIGQMTELLGRIPSIRFLQCIDPERSFCNKLTSRLPHQSVICGTIRDVKSTDWDAIVSINVLEHIEADQDELALYYRLLKNKNGTLNLFVPARPEIFAQIDEDFGHFRRYTKKDIIKKIENAGFKIKKIRYYNFAGYFAWWMNFCILKKRIFEPSKVRFFDRFIFPMVNFVESSGLYPPIGQSLLVMAQV